MRHLCVNIVDGIGQKQLVESLAPVAMGSML